MAAVALGFLVEEFAAARVELPAVAATLGAGFLTAFASTLVASACFLTVVAGAAFLGGVTTLSCTLDADACVGRIIRARNPSSTCFSFFVSG